MRKNFFYLCAALFALSSCTNEIIEEGFVDKSNAISFNSSAPKTRAYTYTEGDVENTTVLKTGNFGVVGYSEDKLYLGATTKAAEQTYDGSNWDYANPGEIRYWPNNNMYFYAYFPYSDTGAEFADPKPANDASVMTITNNTGNQDVLFASTLDQARVNRVDMKFHHAFSKIQGIEIQIKNKDVTVEVQEIEVINTSTKGKVLVDKDGFAKYEDGTGPRVFTLATPVTITKTNTYDNDAVVDQFKTLVKGTDNGYIFATNNAPRNYVSGTNTKLWDGTKTELTEGKTLEDLKQVCLKLTCKVTTPSSAGTNYHVGSADSYGVMYIPISGSSIDIAPTYADKTVLLAGKRYTYKIVMENNVGFDENGNAILLPILFESTSVDNWDDVTVTITL